MISFQIANNSPLYEQALKAKSALEKAIASFKSDLDIVVKVSDEVQLEFESKTLGSNFQIDFTKDKLAWRLAHGGKNSEPVCKAVIGKLTNPIVFDATAGLGRESLILQSGKAQVYMFERNPIIWLMLNSALYKAQNNQEFLDQLKNGLPKLMPLGTIKDQYPSDNLPAPDVIYYDPMFPQRTKSALVKKDMRVFHELIGADTDVFEYANFLCTIAKHHVVVKRPANEDPLELNKRRSSFIDGKACRFDCYYTS